MIFMRLKIVFFMTSTKKKKATDFLSLNTGNISHKHVTTINLFLKIVSLSTSPFLLYLPLPKYFLKSVYFS